MLVSMYWACGIFTALVHHENPILLELLEGLLGVMFLCDVSTVIWIPWLVNPPGTSSLEQENASEKNLRRRLVVWMVGPLCFTATGKSTNLSMYRKCAETSMSSGSLNSSGNCCGSQQVHPRPQEGDVLRASSVFRIFCIKGISGPFGARVASRVELCRRTVGTSTSFRSSAWRGTMDLPLPEAHRLLDCKSR